MPFEVIQGFNMSKNAPLDETRIVAADETAMLAIKWVYKGLLVARIDTSPIELWTCDVAAATLGPTAPFTAIGDWSEFTGTAGTNGTDGSQIYTGTGVPSDALGVNTDFYLDNATGNYYTKAAGTWGSAQGNLTGPTGATGLTGAAGADGDTFTATSATSVNIPTSHPTDVALTLDASTYDYIVGHSVIASEDVSNFFIGHVKTWTGGVLTITSTANIGTGSAPTTSWDVSLAGQTGADGATGPTGSTGAVGPTGATGATGPAGADGVGAPSYGTIYSDGGSSSQVVASGVPEILDQFLTNGPSTSGITPDQTNEKITIDEDGSFNVQVDLSFSGTNSSSWIVNLYANVNSGGSAAVPGVQFSRKLGTGGDIGAATFSCVYTVSGGDSVDLEVWIEGDGANTFLLEYGGLTVTGLGSQGPTGATGAAGATGSTGSTGSTGAQGAQGVAGATGAAGANGSNGSNGSDGAVGKAFIHTENDISLTAAKITTVEGGAWTAALPWSASVQNDARTSTEKNATAGIIGTMTYNSIAYNGTAWFNNGRWLGLTGATGATGASGDQGIQGVKGDDGDGVLVVDAGWAPQADLNFPVVFPTDHAATDIYNKRIRLDTANSTVSTFNIEFPNSVAQLQELRQVTMSILNSVKQVTLVCTTLGGGKFYDSFSGQTASTTLTLNNFMTDNMGAFTFTPLVLGGTCHWQVTGGVQEPAAYAAAVFKVWASIVDDPGYYSNSSNIYSAFHTPTQSGRHLIDIGAQHYRTSGLNDYSYTINFQTYDITQTTLITTTSYSYDPLRDASGAVSGGYRTHMSFAHSLETDKSYRVWLRVGRRLGITQTDSRFLGTDTFGVTYIK